MKLDDLIEKLIDTLEYHNYTLEDLQKKICDCYDDVVDSDDHEKEDNQNESYEQRLQRITDSEDETEKIKELEKFLKYLLDKYKGNNPSKEIRDIVKQIRKLLDKHTRIKRKPFDNNK